MVITHIGYEEVTECQDPEKVGTTLKTVSMFLRAAKTEAEEAGESTEGMATSVSELRQEILDLTGNRVDIQVEGKEEFKSTYQILKELSEVWESLSDLTQANILEMVGGKRNANIVAAIVENFSVADSAFKTSMNSAGSAMTENLKALDSVEGRINIFKAAFESFSANLIGDEMVKDVVDFGTSFIGVLDGITDVINALGGLENALFVVAGIVTMIQSQKIGHFLTVTLGGGIANLGKSIAGIGTTFMTAFSAARASGATTLSALSSGFKGLAASAGAANLAIGSFIAVVSIINMVSDAVERARQEAIAFNEEQAADASSAVDRANALHVAMAEYQRYSQISDRTQDQETAMQNALSTVTEQINSKTTALKGLTEGTREYTAALEEQVRKEIEGTSLEAKKGLQSAESAVRSSAWSDFKGNLTEFKIESNTIHKDQNLLEALKIAENILGDRFGIDNNGHRDSIDRYVAKADINARTQSIEEIVQYFYELKKLEDELATRDVDGNLMGTDLYREVTRKTEELSAVVETLQKAQFDLLSQTYKEENGIPETTDDYKKYVHEIEKSFASAFGYDFIKDTTLIDSILAPFFANEGLADIVVEPIQEVVETVDEVISDNERTRRMVEDFWGGDETSDIADNLKEIADASEEISAEKIVELAEESEELAAILDRPGMTPEFLAGVFEDLANNRNGLDNITDEALELNDVLEGLADQFDSVREAKKRYDDAMSVDEKDTNFKSYAEAYKTLDEEFVAGTINSNAFWASAEYLFGEDLLDKWGWEDGIAQIREAMESNLGMYKDADSAGFGFIDRFLEVADDGKIFDDLGRVIAQISRLPDGGFDIDIDEEAIGSIASLMSLSEDAILASVEALGMWGEIDFYNVEELLKEIGRQSLSIARDGGGQIIDYDALEHQLKNANKTAKEINDIFERLKESGNVTLFGSSMQADEILESLEQLEIATQTEYGIDINYDSLTNLIEQLGLTEDEAKAVIKKLSEVNGVSLKNLKGEIIGVDDAMDGIRYLNLSKTRSEIGQTTSSVDSLSNSLSKINGKTFSFTVSQSNPFVSWTGVPELPSQNDSSSSNPNVWWDTHESGTNNANRGISLVGENGTELVQSGNKARLVGVNGPEVTYLQRGDRVYNAEETEKIMKGLDNHSGSFPAFAGGGVYGGISGNKWESLLDGGGSSSGGSSGGSSSSSSSSSKNGDEESEFERLYKYHQHLLAMEQESVEDYLEWLDKAYREAYNSGQIDLDEYRQYCEEVYQGLRDLFKDYLNDTEHEISMRGNFDGESVKIISLYEEMIGRIEKEIDAAREYGLDNNNDYVQELQDKYVEYTDRIQEIRDEASESAESAIKELVDIRMKMLEEDVEAEKDAIKEKLDNLKDFYDKQKEMLQDLYDEEKYLEEQSEKRKSVSDIQAEIAQLQYDDSAWAQKRKLELASELSEAQKELNQFEKEHALDLTQNKLDEMYELQKKELEDQTETIEKEFEDAKTKYESALSDIRTNSVTLYEEMIVWNQKYGDGIDDTIKTAWEEAYIALKNYHDLYGSFYEGIDLFNATGVPSKGKWESSPISGYASGTPNATVGLHKINELGEEYIFKSATDGSTYKVFSGGEKVLNANATNFLYEFASSKGEILTNFISKLFDGSLLNKIIPSVSTNSIVMGDIIVQGNADMRTVSEIRRAQRENLADMLKSINKLNK